VQARRVARFIPYNVYQPAVMPFHFQIGAPPVPQMPPRPPAPAAQPRDGSVEFALPENKADVAGLLHDLRMSGPDYVPKGYDIVRRGNIPGIIFQGGVVRMVASKVEDERA
jgi:hypothetical protein